MRTDNQLLTDFLHHSDEKAFEEFYNRHQKSMYRKALHFLKDKDEAQDFLQDFWFKIIAHPERINVVKEESVLGYLSAMLVHDLYDYFRKKKLDTVCLDDTLLNDLQQSGDYHVNSVENDVNMNEFREKRESIIRALPESDRQIYTLYDKHHLEIPEIAKQYSLNKNTTRNRIAGISRYIESKLKLLYTSI